MNKTVIITCVLIFFSLLSCTPVEVDNLDGIELTAVDVHVNYTSAKVFGTITDVVDPQRITGIEIRYGRSYDSLTETSVATYDKYNGFNADLLSLEDGCMYYYRVDIIVGKSKIVGDVMDFVTFPAGPIDLDLPSGKKWASHNVGAEIPTDAGGYYAWGEIDEKTCYAWDTYKYCVDGMSNKLTKYVSHNYWAYNGIYDGLYELMPEDDVAYNMYGVGWSIPSYKDWQEILENCRITPVIINGVHGVKVSSNVDANNFKKFIFLSSQHGLYTGTDKNFSWSYYWTSTLNDVSYEAMKVYISSTYSLDSYAIYSIPYHRCYGLSVRPVYTK